MPQTTSRSGVLDPTMSLAGRLEDLSVGEILQIVSLSKRSGLLRLEGPHGKADMFIKEGKVVYSARSDEREGVLSLLVHHGLVEPQAIEPLRAEIEALKGAEDLKAFLSGRLNLRAEVFQRALRKRVEELVYSLFHWEDGTFSFQLVDDERSHPILSGVIPLFLDEGIGAQFLVMEGARRKDEMARSETGHVPAAAPGEGSLETGAPPGEPPPKPAPTPAERMAFEADAFTLPAAMPRMPERLAKAVLLVSDDAALRAAIAGAFGGRDVSVMDAPDAGAALTRVQELRSRNFFPFLVVDLGVPGISDGLQMGGLDFLSTLWDFGFNLPAAVLHRVDLPRTLAGKLSAAGGISIVPDRRPAGAQPSPSTVEQVVEAFRQASGTAGPEPGAEFFDFRQELQADLQAFDLPFEGLPEGGAPPTPSLDPMMARLSSYVSELNRQEVSGEVTLLALRFASEFAARAILFLVRRGDLKGLGQSGVDLGAGLDSDAVIRSLVLPLEEGSVFSRVVAAQSSYHGPPMDGRTERVLQGAIGGARPGRIYVGPIVSMGKVAVLLYADDAPARKGLAPTQTLDIFLSHAGLALDRAYLEMKLKAQRV